MKFKPLFYTSKRFLLSKTNNVKLRNVIAGVALSLIPLILVLIVSDGMIFGITKRYIELGNYHYQLKKISDISSEEMERMILSVEKIEGIKGVYREQQGIALFYGSDQSYGVAVRGLEQSIYDKDDSFRELITVNDGQFDLTERSNILVSSDLASKTGIKTGDRIRLLTAKEIPGRAPLLRPVSFTVKGIISTGYYEIDGLTVYIPFAKAQTLFRDKNPIIGLKVENPIEVDDQFEDQLLSIVHGNWFYKRWDNIEPHKFSSFLNIKFTLLIIMSIIIIVGAVNISSSIVMLVMEKSREIAILKSSGAGKTQIVLIFCTMSTLLGIIGVFFGLIIGLFIGVNINSVIFIIESIINIFVYLINLFMKPFSSVSLGKFTLLNPSYYLEKIPVIINYQFLAFFCSFNIFLSFLAGLIPGLKAGRLQPVEIFQKHI